MKLKTTYDVHPGVAMVQKWTDELPSKTGRTLEQWAKVVVQAKLETSTERKHYLKDNFGFGSNSAAWIAEYAYNRATWDGDAGTYLKNAEGFVAAMYAGPKSGLFPVYQKLVEFARTLGKDVRICPCKTMVPFYRERVFTEIKPATKTRIDISLALSLDVAEKGTLKRHEQRIKKKDRMTHFMSVSTLDDVTPEVLKWIRVAYERDE